jgi:S1-C subfamily serine protease
VTAVASRLPLAALVVLALASAGAPGARGDDATAGLARLESTVVAVAREAATKTVAIRVGAILGGTGWGSGAVISPEGLVLTCAHVSEAGFRGDLTAVFPDRREVKLVVVGSSPRQDVALLRMEPAQADLPHFALAPRDPVVGEYAITLGHPGGAFDDRRASVSVGRVTGVGRRIAVDGSEREYVGVLQTDAPIYGGNSGGPLVDLDGRLAGLNGAIFLVGDAAFSIPASRLGHDLPALRKGRTIETPSLDGLESGLADLLAEVTPGDIDRAFADTLFGNLMRGAFRMQKAGGRTVAKAARRHEAPGWADLANNTADAAATLRVGGVVVGTAWPLEERQGRLRLLASARLARAVGRATLAVELTRAEPGAPDRFSAPVVVVGRDERFDLVLLETRRPVPASSFPTFRALAPRAPEVGAFVVVPTRTGAPARARIGVVAAAPRDVPDHRGDAGLGILDVFRRPSTSPARAFEGVLQIDVRLEENELGGPVLDRAGRVVGLAVAHVHRGATFVVPADVLRDELPALEDGLLVGD